MDTSYQTSPAAAGQFIELASTSHNSTVANVHSYSAPFLKWAGSKRRLLSQLLPLLPRGKRLVEPFVGGGSVFMGTTFDQYLLADTNSTLMNLYNQLKTEPTPFIAQAKALFVEANLSREAYNGLRSRFNDQRTPEAEKAALFVYLNKHAFNGLFRVNKRGQMNVPFAMHAKLPGFPQEAMERFAMKLPKAQLQCADFAQTMSQAVPGDVVYCDPPFASREDEQGNAHKSFATYDRQGFGMDQQAKLAQLARELASKGIPVVISNHDTNATRALYAGATVHAVSSYRSMAASRDARGVVAELVAVFNK